MKISIFADSKFITDGKGKFYSSSNMRKSMLYPIADQCEMLYIICRLNKDDLNQIPQEDQISHPHITFLGVPYFKGIFGSFIHRKQILEKSTYAIQQSDVCVFRFASNISCIASRIARKLKKTSIGHVIGEFDIEVRHNSKHIPIPGVRHIITSWILKRNIAAFRKCDYLCGVTQSMARKYAQPFKEVVQLVDSCLDADCFQFPKPESVNSDSLKAIFAGRLVSFKNIQNFLCAMSKVRQEGIKINATIVGDGNFKDELVRLAQQYGISRYVEFTGRIESRRQLWQKYRQADIGFLFSVSEGLPLSAIESMSVGLPLIGARLEYMESIITDGLEGYLVDPDNIDDIAVKLRILANDPIARYKMALNAFKKSKLFSAENQATKLLGLSKKICKGINS